MLVSDPKLSIDEILSIRQSLTNKLNNGVISYNEYIVRIDYYDGLIHDLYEKHKANK